MLAGRSTLRPWAIGDQPRGSNPKAYLVERKAYRGKRREGEPRESLVLGSFAGSTAGSFDLNLPGPTPISAVFSKRWRSTGINRFRVWTTIHAVSWQRWASD